MITFNIDESGNLGRGGGRFFVITAVRYLDDKRIKNFVKRYKSKKQIPEIKGQRINFNDRQDLINKLNSKNDYLISYIVLDKKNLNNHKLFEDNNILFNYLCSFLFKKILKNNEEDVHLCFDNRTVKVKSGNSLLDYLKIKAYTKWNYLGNLSVSYWDSKSNNCIQMSDLISNTIFRRYSNNKIHFYNQINIAEKIRFPHNNFGK